MASAPRRDGFKRIAPAVDLAKALLEIARGAQACARLRR